MPTYSTALTLLSSCLDRSSHSDPSSNRLAALIPILPNIKLSLLPELLNLGITEQAPGPGQFPLDRRSSACILALARCKNQPISKDLFYLHVLSLSSCKTDPDSGFISSFCKAICESQPTATTTQVIRLTLQSALQNVCLSVLLGLLQALSDPPVLSQSELLQEQLLFTLKLAREQIVQISDSRHRRRKHQWSQIQVRAIRAISVQLQEKLSHDEKLRLSLYNKGLGVLGFKDDTEWRPISSAAISVDMYSACAELCVSCAKSDKELSIELMHCLIKLLKVSSRSGSNLSPTPSNMAVFSQILNCVTRLVVNNHRLIRSAVDQLKELLENSNLQQRSDYEDFHELVSASMAEILKAELSISGRPFADTFARKLVFSLDQNLLITKDDSIMTEQSLLLLLGRVTALVNNPKLTEHVIPMLMNRFTNSPKFLHIVIPHLTDIALVSEARVFNDVVSLLTNIYSKPFIADNKWNRKEIPDALLNLAEHVTNPELRSGLLKSLLKLFKILGRQIQERMEQSVQNSSSMAGVLGFLLPALAVLMVPVDELSAEVHDRGDVSYRAMISTLPATIHRHPSLARISPWDGQSQNPPKPVTAFESVDADVKWFRTLWNYLVLYRFADPTTSMWPPAWANAVKTIAAHTPALALSATETSQHDIELFAETGICQVCIHELRSRLSVLYPIHASVISSLSTGALVYIMSIEVLESARVLSGTVMPLFTYLHDQTAASVTKIVDTVADHVFQSYLDVMASWPADSLRRQNLESHAVFLFAQSCSRYQRAAAKAVLYLKEIVNRFPFLQWSKTCLSCLFRLYNTLQDLSSDIDLISSPNPLPNIGCLQLDLADDWKSRALAQSHIQKMLTRWLENATFIVPSHMASMLQLFIQDWHDKSMKYPTFGVGISLRHLLAGKRQAMLSAPVDQDHSASQFAYSVTARQRYLGDIRGRFFAFCQDSSNERPFGEVMASDLLMEFHEILGRHRIGYEGLEYQFKRCLYLCAALLVWSVTAATADDDAACQMSAISLSQHRAVDPRELMHLVCMAPVYMFTDQTMSYAIDVWSWLFTVSHAFSVGLLVTMKSAWAYTIDARLGLFSVPPDQAAAQFSGYLFTKISPCYRPGWNGAGPHDSWISFLLDRFDTIADCTLGSIRAIHFMLHKALAKPEYICTAPSSFGTRFRLLLLGLRLVNTRSGHDLLRDRIILVAFSWFREGPRWSPHKTWSDVTADAQTIVNFIVAIRRDSGRSPAAPVPVPTSSASVISVPIGNKLGVERAPSVTGSVPQQTPSVMRSVRPGTDPTEVFTFTTSEGQNMTGFLHDWSLRPEIDDAVSIGIRAQKDHIDLLILFLSHEFHCLVAWHNPRRHPDRMLRDENLYAHNLTAGLTQDDWRRYFLVAWYIDPHVAYRLSQRFPYVRLLRSMLRAKLQSEPLALKNIGEAVRLLCNQRNCKLNSPILKHVAFYDSCSLPTALRFLCPPFAQNRIIIQYTLRSLSLHAHSGVIFYMPEIIQALRHDTSASLAEFLKAAGTQSPHLAHQLIWALQTESVVDENARRRVQDDPLPSICSKLEQEVISSFSTEAAAFYRAEFDFFEQITRLSSELLVIPKVQKEERRARLQSELQKIRTDTLQTSQFPLYLPIDHTAQVVDIVIDTAKPLQSAARVPFLVDFLIKKMPDSDDTEEKIFHTKVLELTKETPKIETKQVIFKAGDDCRQDCLALQFIRLFKDILKSVGLPLFVFPYLVIPNRTGPGRDLGGVIECVRKSSSRDELGKTSGLSLRDYFLSKYGRAEGPAFKQAQRNFVLSMAGYAVCCYILQVKDRHNGNILLDEAGHVIHIDFGFIFDISPAKDMKWESAGFKLTLEMVEVMDNFDSDMWNWFVDLCVRGYLAARTHRDDFLALAEIMSDSALGCFKPDSVRNLKHRFVPDKNERDAAQHMISVVLDAYNKFTTNTYDSIQYYQQGIYYYAGQPS